MDSSPYAMATDFLSKGLYDRASAEINRAMTRGSDRAQGLAMLGDVFARQGLYGEALDRYREALRLDPDARRAMVGEAWSLVRLGRAPEARTLAQRLLAENKEDVEILMLTATACAESGDPAAALSALEVARRVAPMRADIQQKIGDISRSLGDNESAISAYRHALQLDQDFAVVRFQLARLLQLKGQNREAEQELVQALDAVPTYAEATLELAMLRRRLGRRAIRSTCSWSCSSAIRTTSTRCSRSARRCRRSDESATRCMRSRAFCASIRRTSARCSTRARSSRSSGGTATRSIDGSACSTWAAAANMRGGRAVRFARRPTCSAFLALEPEDSAWRSKARFASSASTTSSSCST